MGTRWGVNRTVGQIHALFYLSSKPLCTEEVAETLSIARSNANSGLRELENWHLIRPVSKLGDRRRYYEAVTNVWEIFRLIADERKRRELDPTIAFLRSCLAELNTAGSPDPHAKQRLAEALSFLETISSLYEELWGPPARLLRKVAALKSKLKNLISGGSS